MGFTAQVFLQFSNEFRKAFFQLFCRSQFFAKCFFAWYLMFCSFTSDTLYDFQQANYFKNMSVNVPESCFHLVKHDLQEVFTERVQRCLIGQQLTCHLFLSKQVTGSEKKFLGVALCQKSALSTRQRRNIKPLMLHWVGVETATRIRRVR